LNPCGQARFSAAEEQSILITRLAVVSTEEEQQQKEQQQKQDQWLADQQAPAHRKGAFICPNCGAYAHQEWFEILIGGGWGHMDIGSQVSKCAHCGKFAYWVDEKLVYPAKRQGLPPHPEMPDEPRADYNEARGIVGLSPRGACALLRLALQKLCKELGETGKDLNTDIANLVKKGLRVEVQQALDSVRVVGNNSVHPGEFDVTDDQETAMTLFECMNVITEQMISQPRRMSELYSKLPHATPSTSGTSLARRGRDAYLRTLSKLWPRAVLGPGLASRRLGSLQRDPARRLTLRLAFAAD
jgi:hypothetical protein